MVKAKNPYTSWPAISETCVGTTQSHIASCGGHDSRRSDALDLPAEPYRYERGTGLEVSLGRQVRVRNPCVFVLVVHKRLSRDWPPLWALANSTTPTRASSIRLAQAFDWSEVSHTNASAGFPRYPILDYLSDHVLEPSCQETGFPESSSQTTDDAQPIAHRSWTKGGKSWHSHSKCSK